MVGDDTGRAFLAGRGVHVDLVEGLQVEVFIYNDKTGAPLATTERPPVQAGQFAFLKVADVAAHGAYLDWGLPRDLFVPRRLQYHPLHVDDRVVVAVSVDEEGRVFGSSKLADFFESAVGTLQVGDAVQLLVYGFNDLGALSVVDGRFTGLIYRNETFKPARVGDSTVGWVRGVREDGRVDLGLHQVGREGTQDARDVIWERIVANGGSLALTDKSSPEKIRSQLQMSKKAFKKAVGSLYKERRIVIEDGGLRMATDAE